MVRGADALARHDPGGLELFEADLETFAATLRRENHTLKRSLTDPHLISGIGNAYSDEILHRARLSPLKLTARKTDDEVATLFDAARTVLVEWTGRLGDETGEGFPEKVSAFRPEMAVHGRYGKPCPDCGTAVQRIIYTESETNYCPRCRRVASCSPTGQCRAWIRRGGTVERAKQARPWMGVQPRATSLSLRRPCHPQS